MKEKNNDKKRNVKNNFLLLRSAQDSILSNNILLVDKPGFAFLCVVVLAIIYYSDLQK
jgi:hypothetical protein